MRWPWVDRERLEAVEAMFNLAVARADLATSNLVTERARYDDLLEKYHELRVSGAASAPPPPPPLALSPLASLGPRASAALKEMGAGQSLSVRRAMEAKAVGLFAEGMADEHLARTIRKGESALGALRLTADG